MDASRVLRPIGVAAAAAVLLTGAACNGPLARRANRRQTPVVTTATTVAPAPTPAAAPAPRSGQPVRTDDLDAGLQQADTQLSQSGGAVADADQNPQQTND